MLGQRLASSDISRNCWRSALGAVSLMRCSRSLPISRTRFMMSGILTVIGRLGLLRFQAASLSRPRLLQWVVAHAGLSAAWFLEDQERERAMNELQVARLAQRALAQLNT